LRAIEALNHRAGLWLGERAVRERADFFFFIIVFPR
jgi:hypothetical protein